MSTSEQDVNVREPAPTHLFPETTHRKSPRGQEPQQRESLGTENCSLQQIPTRVSSIRRPGYPRRFDTQEKSRESRVVVPNPTQTLPQKANDDVPTKGSEPDPFPAIIPRELSQETATSQASSLRRALGSTNLRSLRSSFEGVKDRREHFRESLLLALRKSVTGTPSPYAINDTYPKPREPLEPSNIPRNRSQDTVSSHGSTGAAAHRILSQETTETDTFVTAPQAPSSQKTKDAWVNDTRESLPRGRPTDTYESLEDRPWSQTTTYTNRLSHADSLESHAPHLLSGERPQIMSAERQYVAHQAPAPAPAPAPTPIPSPAPSPSPASTSSPALALAAKPKSHRKKFCVTGAILTILAATLIPSLIISLSHRSRAQTPQKVRIVLNTQTVTATVAGTDPTVLTLPVLTLPGRGKRCVRSASGRHLGIHGGLGVVAAVETGTSLETAGGEVTSLPWRDGVWKTDMETETDMMGAPEEMTEMVVARATTRADDSERIVLTEYLTMVADTAAAAGAERIKVTDYTTTIKHVKVTVTVTDHTTTATAAVAASRDPPTGSNQTRPTTAAVLQIQVQVVGNDASSLSEELAMVAWMVVALGRVLLVVGMLLV